MLLFFDLLIILQISVFSYTQKSPHCVIDIAKIFEVLCLIYKAYKRPNFVQTVNSY